MTTRTRDTQRSNMKFYESSISIVLAGTSPNDDALDQMDRTYHEGCVPEKPRAETGRWGKHGQIAVQFLESQAEVAMWEDDGCLHCSACDKHIFRASDTADACIDCEWDAGWLSSTGEYIGPDRD
jgi:hypothetical protein